MELIFSNEHYSNTGELSDEYLLNFRNELISFDNKLKIDEADLGYAADFPVILVEIFRDVDWSSIFKVGAIPTIFFLGKKINENVDAWLELTRKLKKLFEKKKPVRIDEKAAFLLLIDLLSQENLDLNDLEISFRVYSYGDYGYKKGNSRLSPYPDSLYIFDVKAKESFHIIGMRSDSVIDFHKKYGAGWYNFYVDAKKLEDNAPVQVSAIATQEPIVPFKKWWHFWK